jgi:AraC family transcriptional regulator
MQPTITKKPEMYFVGMSFYGDPFSTRGGWDGENEIGRVWARFMKYLGENGEKILHSTQHGVAYEIQVYNEETTTKGVFEVFVGIRVNQIENVPPELLVKTLPATEYAVFTFEGEQISSDWHMEIDQWISATGYQTAYPFSFQYYDDRFKGLDKIEESILDVYMPVKPLAESDQPTAENQSPTADS